MRYNKTFAAIVTPGNTYRLWAVASADARTRQKGSDSEGTAITRFPAPATDGAVAVFTGVGDLKTVQISGNQAFSTAGCANEEVLVKSDGVLTVDADNAAVRIYTVAGIEVKAVSHLNGSVSIDLSDLPNGIYVCRLNEANGTRTLKFAK